MSRRPVWSWSDVQKQAAPKPLRLTLDDAHRAMLADIAADSGRSIDDVALSILVAVLEDDAAAHEAGR